MCQTRGRGVSARERTTRTERFLGLAGTFSRYKNVHVFSLFSQHLSFLLPLLGSPISAIPLFAPFSYRRGSSHPPASLSLSVCLFIDGTLGSLCFFWSSRGERREKASLAAQLRTRYRVSWERSLSVCTPSDTEIICV